MGLLVKIKDVIQKRETTKLPIFIGSWVTPNNIGAIKNELVCAPNPDGFIIGSCFKHDSHWDNEIKVDRVKRLIEARNNYYGC